MDLDGLMKRDATCSFYTSKTMVIEMLQKEDWRTYSSLTTDKVDQVIDRFLKNHARIPGLISKEVYAQVPAQVFYWADDTGSFKGGLFANGAVMVANRSDGSVIRTLFIDDVTARRYLYPGEDHYKNLGRMVREGVQELIKDD